MKENIIITDCDICGIRSIVECNENNVVAVERDYDTYDYYCKCPVCGSIINVNSLLSENIAKVIAKSHPGCGNKIYELWFKEERLRHISGLIEELVIVKEDLENEISKLLLR